MTVAESEARPQTRRCTPEDLLTMPDGDRYELVDGQLVGRNMGQFSSWIAGQVVRLIGEFCHRNGLGWVMPSDCGYQCFPDAPKTVRFPDASFIRRGRLPSERPYRGHCRIAPDLAVEVVSPNDLYWEVEAKVTEYLGAGVRLIWVIDPETRTVRVHRADGTVADLRDVAAVLPGEDVLPGFSCRVADLFPPTETPAPNA